MAVTINNWELAVAILAIVVTAVFYIIGFPGLYNTWQENNNQNEFKDKVSSSIHNADILLDSGDYEQAINQLMNLLNTIPPQKYPFEYGLIEENLGVAHYVLSIRSNNKEINAKKSISFFREALKILTAESYPAYYAMTQNSLGYAYLSLSEVRDKEENINNAIQAGQESLKIYVSGVHRDYQNASYTTNYPRGKITSKVAIFESYPTGYAACQNVLGEAYLELANVRDNEENVGKAIQSFEDALKVITIDGHPGPYPIQYALNQKDLGNAYLFLSDIRDGKENLNNSVHACQEALKIFTLESYPLDNALILMNLGNAYLFLSFYQDEEDNLNKSIQTYNEALKVITIKSSSLDYAKIQMNKGNAYGLLSAIRNEDGNLRDAMQSCQEALKVFTIESYPTYYAYTQTVLGDVYFDLSYVRDMKENLVQSNKSYEEALKILTTERYPVTNAGILDRLNSTSLRSSELIASHNASFFAEAWDLVSCDFAREGKYRQAFYGFKRATRINPKYAPAWFDKGVALNALGRYNEAIKAYDRAIELDPQFMASWVNKGLHSST